MPIGACDPDGMMVCPIRVGQADNNSYIEVYYQIGGADTREFVLSQFMQDIMQEPLFNELRTNQQLGYSVNCSYRMTHGHLGFLVTCQPQSTKFDLDEVDGRIEKFFDFFEEFLNDMSDADYKNQVEASVAEKLRPDNNLGERTYRYWTEITAHSYQFVRLKQEAAIAQTITKVRQFSANVLLTLNQSLRGSDLHAAPRAPACRALFGAQT